MAGTVTGGGRGDTASSVMSSPWPRTLVVILLLGGLLKFPVPSAQLCSDHGGGRWLWVLDGPLFLSRHSPVWHAGNQSHLCQLPKK